jgi:hypothetical protein
LSSSLQVKVLKEKIEAEKGRDAFPVAGQKLIYASKILSDDVPISDYRIDEKNFVVVMVTKAKAGQGTSAPPEVSFDETMTELQPHAERLTETGLHLNLGYLGFFCLFVCLVCFVGFFSPLMRQ